MFRSLDWCLPYLSPPNFQSDHQVWEPDLDATLFAKLFSERLKRWKTDLFLRLQQTDNQQNKEIKSFWSDNPQEKQEA